MTTITSTYLHANIAAVENTVCYGAERLLVERHGKPVVALVPVEDLRLLESLENLVDVVEVAKALEEYEATGEGTPARDFFASLGL